MLFGRIKSTLVSTDEALPGRAERPFAVAERHAVLRTPMQGPWPAPLQVAVVAMGCFWGAERIFWRLPGVHSTAVGYAGGHTPNPTYEEVCTGRTGHTEVVQVVFDPTVLPYTELLRTFWEGHDPTQGFRQGNDIGTQYRSAVYTSDDDQLALAEQSRSAYDAVLQQRGYGAITTEVRPAPAFYYAEDYHQQYLYKVPDGYCGIGGTGVACPVGLGSAAQDGRTIAE
jgi:peptide-methionine (S)-S-oxide reductase